MIDDSPAPELAPEMVPDTVPEIVPEPTATDVANTPIYARLLAELTAAGPDPAAAEEVTEVSP
ncbi:hypothetical protein [Pseudonocardia sp.]|uniref:hypothetical protein n=1 Tax=Pseudonocardia sp. TaxID=60912 RepID=UPI003D1001D1